MHVLAGAGGNDLEHRIVCLCVFSICLCLAFLLLLFSTFPRTKKQRKMHQFLCKCKKNRHLTENPLKLVQGFSSLIYFPYSFCFLPSKGCLSLSPGSDVFLTLKGLQSMYFVPPPSLSWICVLFILEKQQKTRAVFLSPLIMPGDIQFSVVFFLALVWTMRRKQEVSFDLPLKCCSFFFRVPWAANASLSNSVHCWNY